MESVKRSLFDLKSIMDQYQKIDIDSYNGLTKFMQFKTKKAKTVVRPAGEIETESRILLSGLIGAYRDGKLIRLFFPEEICMDSASYFDWEASKIELKALEDVVYSSLTHESAALVLETLPEFQKISPILIAMAKASNDNWIALTQMPWRDLLFYLKSKHPGIESLVSQKDLAGLIHIDPKTLQRLNRREYEKARSQRLFKLLDNFLQYPFKPLIHNRSEEIEEQAVDWARYIQGFLMDSVYQHKFRKMNLAGLSTHLYPEASFQNSVWISKLYLLLFAMDDLSDQITDSLKVLFWRKIQTGCLKILSEDANLGFPGQQILGFLGSFKELYEEFKSLNQVDPVYLDLFKLEFKGYLEANVWEAQNRANQKVPTIEEYLEKRPVFSGGNLSIFLCPLSINREFSSIVSEWKKLEVYRNTASKLIFISNDLISFLKEKKNGDFHNWLTLLIHHEKVSQEEARSYLLDEHQKALKEFLKIYQDFKTQYSIQDGLLFTLMREIKYKVSGAVHWSLHHSSRYQTEGRDAS